MSNIGDLLSGNTDDTKLEVEDSEGFTDEEAQSALPVSTVGCMIEDLKSSLGCPECGAKRSLTAHRLRRKIPHLYACVSVSCNECLTDSQLVYRADWLQESS